MGIGFSIFLIAIGAILDFAVNVHANGVDLATVGVILMVVGGLGVVLSMLFWSSWGGFGGGGRRRTEIVETRDGDYVGAPGGRRVTRDDRYERY